MMPLSAKEAKSLGLSRYFTGVPCCNGHVSLRRTDCRRCMECERDAQRNKKHRYKDSNKCANCGKSPTVTKWYCWECADKKL